VTTVVSHEAAFAFAKILPQATTMAEVELAKPGVDGITEEDDTQACHITFHTHNLH
jgi:hypothetical protein